MDIKACGVAVANYGGTCTLFANVVGGSTELAFFDELGVHSVVLTEKDFPGVVVVDTTSESPNSDFVLAALGVEENGDVVAVVCTKKGFIKIMESGEVCVPELGITEPSLTLGSYYFDDIDSDEEIYDAVVSATEMF